MIVDIEEYRIIFGRDPEKDAKTNEAIEHNGTHWIISRINVCYLKNHKQGTVELSVCSEANRRRQWANDNACKFCDGSRFHSCTRYDCRPAFALAEEYYDKWIRRKKMENKKAIEVLQKHIDTYKHQLTDAGWSEMVRMGIVRPTVKERLLYAADADEQISAYETAIEALKKTMSEGDKNVDINSK